MRIISGIFKSRILKTPGKSDETRPTTDRAKETLFNLLNNKINFEDVICLDLFCGTGSFGLECISRGAQKAFFVDSNTKIVESNVNLLNADDKTFIIRYDVISFLKNDYKGECNLVFADPPYNYKKYDLLISYLSGFKSHFILEHSDKFIYNGEHIDKIILKKKVGTSEFTFFNFN
jgi:16S rRNA (guanine(966)-N(2))-methyltransferase RsmD